MKINGNEIKAKKFAYDGCHKIYIIESAENEKEAKEYGYDIYDISLIKETYENSCPLKFISNWNLDKQYVLQGENAIFDFDNIVEKEINKILKGKEDIYKIKLRNSEEDLETKWLNLTAEQVEKIMKIIN